MWFLSVETSKQQVAVSNENASPQNAQFQLVRKSGQLIYYREHVDT
jgi:hypothetical protein